jgi:hypothetical protein
MLLTSGILPLHFLFRRADIKTIIQSAAKNPERKSLPCALNDTMGSSIRELFRLGNHSYKKGAIAKSQ